MISTFYGVYFDIKIMVNEKYFLFDRKFFFNFRKMAYGFQTINHFFDFEHVIFKLMDPTKTHLEPHWDLIGTYRGLDWGSPKTRSGLCRDLPKTRKDLTENCLIPRRDLLGTRSGLAQDPLEIPPEHTWDLTRLEQDLLET